MNALVISGGGSKGAFAGGIAEYLMTDCGAKYDLFVGSSTGSLLLSHLALGDVEKKKKIFTSVEQKDIFHINPFKIKETKEGEFNVSINHWNMIKSFITKKQTFGDSISLRRLIKEGLSKSDYEKILALNKQVVVSVYNLNKLRTEFKQNTAYSSTHCIDCMWT